MFEEAQGTSFDPNQARGCNSSQFNWDISNIGLLKHFYFLFRKGRAGFAEQK